MKAMRLGMGWDAGSQVDGRGQLWGRVPHTAGVGQAREAVSIGMENKDGHGGFVQMAGQWLKGSGRWGKCLKIRVQGRVIKEIRMGSLGGRQPVTFVIITHLLRAQKLPVFTN